MAKNYEKNPICELFDVVDKEQLPHPRFVFSYDSKIKKHHCTVHLIKLNVTASGDSKKIAKKQACKQILEKLRDNPNKALKNEINLSLLKPSYIPAKSYLKMVNDLAWLHKFDVSDVYLQSTKGLHQCQLQISTHPALVILGSGVTKDEALAKALTNAVFELNVMMRQ